MPGGHDVVRDASAVGVVGGGIVGLAVARELTRRQPGRDVLVLEKEDELAAHQTGHNSGVVHAGVYYAPGSLKARLCTRGRAQLREHCAEHDLPYEECGKLVVAVEHAELDGLDELERRSRENGVPGLRRVDGGGIVEVEPHATGIAALHSPRTAITDFAAVATSYAEDVRRAGGRVELGSPVTSVARRSWGIQVDTPTTTHRVGALVLCAGLQSDRVARLAGGAEGPRIVPFRGEYLTVLPEKQELVRGLVYPVPDPRYPFLGVHFTRRVDGGLEVGPNAVLALAREGYGRSDVAWADVRDIVTWPGSWRLASEHWRTGVRELAGSLSTTAYMRRAGRYVPSIGADDVVRGRVGVRAQAVTRAGELVDDFHVEEDDGIVSVRNAPSPAATSALAIAEHVLDRWRP